MNPASRPAGASGEGRAVIIGAGPAGLTAAHELAARARIVPVVLEKSGMVGGISRTVEYKGNRIDLGGHRFFSKSDRVMEWWLRMLPLEPGADVSRAALRYRGLQRRLDTPAPAGPGGDRVMLLRPRRSRIYYLRRLFDYPVTLSRDTLVKLGLRRTLRIGASYLRSALRPRKPEATLEDFFINRFGRELYRTFFQSYTEKVWGVPCSRIGAGWGAQRIKGLSAWAALRHAFLRTLGADGSGVGRRDGETSLIESFLYPKFGPGQMWEETARRVQALGGEILTGWRVDRLITSDRRVTAVEAVETATGRRRSFPGQYFFSTAPVAELMRSFDVPPPAGVLQVSDGLIYRDFMTVGLLLRSLRLQDETPQGKRPIRDNWIYIQEPEVQLGRLQIFNNWSPHLAADPGTVWLGLEYFCDQTGRIWNLPDSEMAALAIEELARIRIIDPAEVLDWTVLRMEKAYPAYFGTYDRFAEIRQFVDRFENLFLIGRNGMHRYNNQDHSMLTAMMVVDGLIAGSVDRAALWNLNSEVDYQEDRKG